MSAIVFCVPYMDRAKGAPSTFHDAPYATSFFALDMNPNFSVPRKSAGGDELTMVFNADAATVGGGTLLEFKDDVGGSGTTLVDVDFAAVWLANWKLMTTTPAEGQIYVTSASNESISTNVVLRMTMDIVEMKGPLIARLFASGESGKLFNQFWEFDFDASPPDALEGPPEISFICVGRKYKINAQWNWNAPDSRRHLNIVDELDSGRVLVRNQNKRGIQVRMLRFELLTTADYEKIRDAHRDARGRYMPIIVGTVVDDPAVGEYIVSPRLMRFATDELQEQPVQAGLWNVDVPLIEVPWLERPFAY